MFHRRWNIPARGPGVDMTLSRYSVRVEMVGTTAIHRVSTSGIHAASSMTTWPV